MAGTDGTRRSLVGRGKEIGCNGVLVVQLSPLNFVVKHTAVPLVHATVAAAQAELGLVGGLIDVQTAAAVAPVIGARVQSPCKSLIRISHDGPGRAGLERLRKNPCCSGSL